LRRAIAPVHTHDPQEAEHNRALLQSFGNLQVQAIDLNEHIGISKQ